MTKKYKVDCDMNIQFTLEVDESTTDEEAWELAHEAAQSLTVENPAGYSLTIDNDLFADVCHIEEIAS